MRILTLGAPMPGPQVDNHSFANAPAFFDYDAIVVAPRALSQLIEEVVSGDAEHATRTGERLVNGPAGPDTVPLSDLLRDRRAETARLLRRGGLVVCHAEPNAPHPGVAGFSNCDRYCWLPAPDGLQYGPPMLLRGGGSELALPETDHPFGAYVAQLHTRLAYSAYFADDVAGTGRVFARSAGGAVVGVDLAVDGGRVVFLPQPARPPTADERYAFSNALQEAIRGTLRLAAAAHPPAWLAGYDLPGLAERRAARDDAAASTDAGQQALAAAGESLDELERYRRLLWQEGRFGLEEPVRQALALLGFRVVPEDLDKPASLQLGEGGEQRAACLEVEGGVEAIGLEGHHRLRHRLEEAIAQSSPTRGVLVINGYRRLPPAERPPQYQEPLRIAAETMRYCLVTTGQLFHAVRAALAGDDATVRAFCERLLTTDGVLRED